MGPDGMLVKSLHKIHDHYVAFHVAILSGVIKKYTKSSKLWMNKN